MGLKKQGIKPCVKEITFIDVTKQKYHSPR